MAILKGNCGNQPQNVFVAEGIADFRWQIEIFYERLASFLNLQLHLSLPAFRESLKSFMRSLSLLVCVS